LVPSDPALAPPPRFCRTNSPAAPTTPALLRQAHMGMERTLENRQAKRANVR
jgi:hypothetical protein